jgi:hypothetical protein
MKEEKKHEKTLSRLSIKQKIIIKKFLVSAKKNEENAIF